ncbi:hypothetical protein TIFTF001_038966 [Ficus carica]|uniref:Retrotransposon gag domain-containing protein n=1 Tax=Ficus carica TaxID=3494 RepID=A0AA88JFC0_FICCA|nr:hypothetical protein TIFTF001_038966 [Ficus carica]
MAVLMNVKMESNKSLKTFLERFTHELNQMEVVDERMVANNFRDDLMYINIDMNPVPNQVQIEKDCEVSLAFWGMAPHLFDGTQEAAVFAKWLHDMEILFQLCDIGAHLQVMLASRCLIKEACAWWLNIGSPEVPKDTWTSFRALITLRFGPLPGAQTLEDDDDYHLLSPDADDDHPLTPVDDAGVGGPTYHNPPVIIIANDDEDGDEEEEEDPKEILISDDDNDKDTDSVVFSDISPDMYRTSVRHY